MAQDYYVPATTVNFRNSETKQIGGRDIIDGQWKEYDRANSGVRESPKAKSDFHLNLHALSGGLSSVGGSLLGGLSFFFGLFIVNMLLRKYLYPEARFFGFHDFIVSFTSSSWSNMMNNTIQNMKAFAAEQFIAGASSGDVLKIILSAVTTIGTVFVYIFNFIGSIFVMAYNLVSVVAPGAGSAAAGNGFNDARDALWQIWIS